MQHLYRLIYRLRTPLWAKPVVINHRYLIDYSNRAPRTKNQTSKNTSNKWKLKKVKSAPSSPKSWDSKSNNCLPQTTPERTQIATKAGTIQIWETVEIRLKSNRFRIENLKIRQINYMLWELKLNKQEEIRPQMKLNMKKHKKSALSNPQYWKRVWIAQVLWILIGLWLMWKVKPLTKTS